MSPISSAPANGCFLWPRSTTISEKRGWAEPQIVIRFWIISVILAMVGLATLKVR